MRLLQVYCLLPTANRVLTVSGMRLVVIGYFQLTAYRPLPTQKTLPPLVD